MQWNRDQRSLYNSERKKKGLGGTKHGSSQTFTVFIKKHHEENNSLSDSVQTANISFQEPALFSEREVIWETYGINTAVVTKMQKISIEAEAYILNRFYV
jgi:hypothetical protein